MKTSSFVPKGGTAAQNEEQAAGYETPRAERFDVAHHTAPNRAERRMRERQGYNRANGRTNTPLERS